MIGRNGFFIKAVAVFIALLAVALAFGGCSESQGRAVPEYKRGNYPQIFNMVCFSAFNSGRGGLATQLQDEWLSDVGDRYRVNINLTNGSGNSAWQMQQDLLYGESNFNGFFNLDYGQVWALSNTDKIVPLDDYLNANPTWQALPEDIRALFEINGHIWAIPSYYDYSVGSRAYLKSAIAAAELSGAPDTIDELRTLINKCTERNQTAIGAYRPNSGYEWAYDLLRMFGLYADYNAYAYDPIEGCITDFLLKPEALEGLIFLNQMYTSGALGEALTDSRSDYTEKVNNGEVASYNASVAVSSDDKAICGITLNSDYPQLLSKQASGYVLTAACGEKQQYVDFLVELMFGSEKNFYQARFGLDKYMLYKSDGTVKIKTVTDPDTGEQAELCYAGICNKLPGVFGTTAYSTYFSASNSDAANAAAFERVKSNYEAIDRAIAEGTVIDKDISYCYLLGGQYGDYSDFTRQQSGFFNSCLRNCIFIKGAAVAHELETYRFRMSSAMGQETLDAMNAAIGCQSAQRYYEGR